jgi:hypothetical protein
MAGHGDRPSTLTFGAEKLAEGETGRGAFELIVLTGG